jgi:NDP-sugar pyrophosphorylase family protein
VGIDAEGNVVRLRGQTFGTEARGGEFIGVHVVGRRARDLLPETGCLVGDVYLPALRRGAILRAFEHHASFIDIGTLTSYVAANRAWLAARSLTSWVHPTAKVHAAAIDSVIGAGARVEAPVHACVVWPNARVTEPLRERIVMPNAIVPYST